MNAAKPSPKAPARTMTMTKTDVKSVAHRVLSSLPKGTFATLGSAFGPAGAAAGTTLAKITGYGDYTVSENNLLTGTSKFGGEVPQFNNGADKTIIRHREYVGPVVSSGIPFSNVSYDINPGNSALFPWLAAVARSYQQYRFRGCVFIFKSLTSDYAAAGGMGQVILATNYNVNDDPFSSTVQMQNSEYAVASKPSVSLLHPLECATSVRRNDPFYVYDPNSNTQGSFVDKRFRDMGKFQIATEGLSTAEDVVIGQLWVSYDVELIKPIVPAPTIPPPLPPSPDQVLFGSFSSLNYTGVGSWTASTPLSGVTVEGVGAGGGILVSINGHPGKLALIDVYLSGSGMLSNTMVVNNMTTSGNDRYGRYVAQISSECVAWVNGVLGAATGGDSEVQLTVPASTTYGSGRVVVTLISLTS